MVFEIFYDGACPLCRREMEMWKRKDHRGRVRFTDIADPAFNPATTGLTFDQLMAELHGRLVTGQVTRGVETFRQLLLALGYRWPVKLSRWPGVRQLLDIGYGIFARNRLRLTGRCESECRLPGSESSPARGA